MRETPISTAGRVFTAQFTRDLAARERAGANAFVPGSDKWEKAFRTFAQKLAAVGSPVRAADYFRAALKRLREAQKQSACFVNYFATRSRSGHFEVVTYEVSKHPLYPTREEGIIVRNYICVLRRTGQIMVGVQGKLAFVSWHALGRMRERSTVDIFQANGTVAICGLAGYLMRQSDKHANTEINLATEDNILCTGVLRIADNEKGLPYAFFDVVTTLPLDEVDQRKRDQGSAIAWAVHNYVTSKDADPTGYADKIAVLPWRGDDFVSRELQRPSAASLEQPR